jgi:hypothetical protein
MTQTEDQQRDIANHCVGNILKKGGSVVIATIAKGIKDSDESFKYKNIDSDSEEAIAYLIAEDKRFTFSVRDDGHFTVFKNPNYKKQNFAERHPFWFPVILSIISASLSLIVGWLLLQSSNQSQYRIDTRQDSTIEETSERLTNLENRVDTL